MTTDSGNLATTGKGSGGACALTVSNVCTPEAVLINVRRTSCPTANAFPRFVNTASIPDRTDTGTFAADVVVVVVVRRMVEDDIWIFDFSLALRATQF